MPGKNPQQRPQGHLPHRGQPPLLWAAGLLCEPRLGLGQGGRFLQGVHGLLVHQAVVPAIAKKTGHAAQHDGTEQGHADLCLPGQGAECPRPHQYGQKQGHAAPHRGWPPQPAQQAPAQGAKGGGMVPGWRGAAQGFKPGKDTLVIRCAHWADGMQIQLGQKPGGGGRGIVLGDRHRHGGKLWHVQHRADPIPWCRNAAVWCWQGRFTFTLAFFQFPPPLCAAAAGQQGATGHKG